MAPLLLLLELLELLLELDELDGEEGGDAGRCDCRSDGDKSRESCDDDDGVLGDGSVGEESFGDPSKCCSWRGGEGGGDCLGDLGGDLGGVRSNTDGRSVESDDPNVSSGSGDSDPSAESVGLLNLSKTTSSTGLCWSATAGEGIVRSVSSLSWGLLSGGKSSLLGPCSSVVSEDDSR